ncbi:hypothetical protein SAMN04489725_11195 [Alicyclobacillus hesperidum]|uniref:Uncharacterized protein n=1 Tax=Alicyclobacillus hesperidum TaxID=89784 RepID=A0A1H2VNN8_9BACL|nr:hypothetical protein SAMN04489725_11195 [Alicyclobacillus hesperidum]
MGQDEAGIPASFLFVVRMGIIVYGKTEWITQFNEGSHGTASLFSGGVKSCFDKRVDIGGSSFLPS